MEYQFDENGICEIPELKMHFQFYKNRSDQPKDQGFISTQYPGLDFFGLGAFGSSVSVPFGQDKNQILNELIVKGTADAVKVIRVSRYGNREKVVGDKYLVKFERPGLIHKGTWFESHSELREYAQLIADRTHYGSGFTVKVFFNEKLIYVGKAEPEKFIHWELVDHSVFQKVLDEMDQKFRGV